MKNKHQKFTLKQEKFIEEYLIDGNGTRACIAAGYSPLTATFIAAENLTKPYIAEEIQKRTEAIKKKFEIKREFIVEELQELIRRSRNDQDRTSHLKALDMLNKMSGQYTETRINLNVDQPLFPREDNV